MMWGKKGIIGEDLAKTSNIRENFSKSSIFFVRKNFVRGAIVPLLISVIKFYLSTELYGNSVQLGGARKGATFFCIYSWR